MKRIEAIIRPERLNDVKERLAEIQVQGVTVVEARGFGRQKGHTEHYRGTEYTVDFLPKVFLTILAPEDQVEAIKSAIIEGARTGKFGDGKIFITSVEEVIRIRTGEEGADAV